MDKTIRAYNPKDIENYSILDRIAQLNKKFPVDNQIIKTIVENIYLQQNTLLYSKGGYGKSYIAEEICKHLGFKTTVVVCHKSMSVDKLIGTIDLKALKEKSSYDIKFENSPLMTPGVLILEEISDAELSIILILKDILTAGGYRYRDEFIPHKIQAVIATSNKDPRTMNLSESGKAFYMSRFTAHLNMDWETHLPQNYIDLFKHHYKKITEELEIVSHICADKEVDPRLALNAAERAKVFGIKSVLNMHPFQNFELDVIMHEYYDAQTQ